MKCAVTAFTLAITAFIATTQCQSAVYIKFDGVDGESRNVAHEGWSELAAFAVEFERPAAGGAEVAINFSGPADRSLPQLIDSLGRNLVFKTVQLDVFDTVDDSDGSVGSLFLYELSQARLAELTVVHGSTGAGQIRGTLISSELSVEHVPTGSLTVWDYGSVAAAVALPGDYNADGYVDAKDYSKWRSTYGATMATLGGGADGNGDGFVDAADYPVWRDYAGAFSSIGATVTTLPEPTCTLLLITAIGAVGCTRRSRVG